MRRLDLPASRMTQDPRAGGVYRQTRGANDELRGASSPHWHRGLEVGRLQDPMSLEETSNVLCTPSGPGARVPSAQRRQVA
jgi:hypothetical protein